MDIGSIFFISGIIILVIVFISQPFTMRKPSRIIPREPELSSLIADQEHIIDAILELDFDYNLGKIPAEEYPTQRNILLAQGAQVMKQLDKLQAQKESSGLVSGRNAKGNIQQKKTSSTSRRKEGRMKLPLKTPDDDLEILLASRRRERGEKAGGFCPQCGNPIQQSDRFCSRCGEAFSPVENSQP